MDYDTGYDGEISDQETLIVEESADGLLRLRWRHDQVIGGGAGDGDLDVAPRICQLCYEHNGLIPETSKIQLHAPK